MARTRSVDFLPEIFQTDANKEFLGATLDQLIQKPKLKRTQGYIGRRFGPGTNYNDGYLLEPTVDRANYQFEPAITFLDKDKNVDDAITYPEIIDALNVKGAKTNKHDRLFVSESYSWNPLIDFDKLINYGQYYWLPTGPDSVDVFSGLVPISDSFDISTSELGYYNLSGVEGENPTITLARGGNYDFVVNQDAGFWIQVEPGVDGKLGYSPNIDSREVLGVTDNGYNTGMVSFNVPDANAQSYYQNLVIRSDIDFITTKRFNEIDGKQVSEVYAIDDIQDMEGRTLIFIDNLIGDSEDMGWMHESNYNANPYDDTPYSDTTYYDTLDQRTSLFRITYVRPTAGTDDDAYIHLIPIDQIAVEERFTVNFGTEYANRTFYRNVSGVFEEVPLLTASNDILYYQDGADPDKFGVIKLIDQDASATIDINDILGEKFYTSPNGVTFTNGMKVKFRGDVNPVEYQDREYFVEGVGTSIKLVPLGDLITPESYVEEVAAPWDTTPWDSVAFEESANAPLIPDYLTINRASQDLNSWTRSNRWVHIDVIRATAEYNETLVTVDNKYRAQRPIIEFVPNLRLFNYGVRILDVIDVIDTTETDALSNVHGSTSHFVDGHPLEVGSRVVFAADTDNEVRNKIYEVQIVDPDGVDPEYTDIINLVDTGLEAEPNQMVICRSGLTLAGQQFKFDGIEWTQCQPKTQVNQAPLFDVYDSQTISFSDVDVYEETSFTGSKIFSYKEGTSNIIDPVLGFPLSYLNIDNLGDIVFENNLFADSFTYIQNSTQLSSSISNGYVRQYTDLTNYNLEIGWTKSVEQNWPRQVFEFIYEGRDLLLDVTPRTDLVFDTIAVKVYVDNKFVRPTEYVINVEEDQTTINFNNQLDEGTVIQVKIIANEESVVGYYEIPSNLESNAFNENVDQLSLGVVRNHYNRLAENVENFEGSINGANNLRDVGNLPAYGDVIVQHSAPVAPMATILRNTEYDFFAATEYTSKQYEKFKHQIIEYVANNEVYDIPVSDVLERALKEINVGKTKEAAFYWSAMLPFGGDYQETDYIISVISTDTFNTINTYDFDTASNYQGLLVYLNDELLIRDYDYTVATDGPRITVIRDLEFDDVLKIREFNTSYGNFVPPTPTKMGLYPAFKPELVLDTTPVGGPQYMIQGHDGSLTLAFGDLRDDVLLEFETRIFSNLRSREATPPPISVADIIPGQFRTTEYSEQEVLDILSPDFLNWCGWNKLAYKEQRYLKENEWTWNYNTASNKLNDEPLNGNWRGVYKHVYDTDRPHTHPWEMLGLSEAPEWWETRYGPAPYTSGNLVLWKDLEQGLVSHPIYPYTKEQFKRPGLLDIIPVDTSGALRTPFDVLVKNYVATDLERSWRVGDIGPVESAWRRSSAWPFAVQRLFALTKPAKYFSLSIDRDRWEYYKPVDQFLYDGRNRLNVKEVEVPGPGVAKHSYLNWIIDYNKNFGIDATEDLTTTLENLDVRLAYRMVGFTDKKYLKIFTDKSSPDSINTSLLIPDESYNIVVHKNQPFGDLQYSSIIVQKTSNGYAVYGMSNNEATFKVMRSIPNGNYETFYVGSPGGKNQTLRIARDFSDDVYQVPYGTVFTSENAVIDFIASYGEFLNRSGMRFAEMENGLEMNWNRMCQEFAYWANQGWDIGSLVNLNPSANTLEYEKELAVVDDLNNLALNEMPLDQNRQPILNKDYCITRLDNNFKFKSLTNDTVSYLRIRSTSYEHLLILDNASIFNDLIYQPVTGMRQQRVKLDGFTTFDWNGQLDAPGFMLNQDTVQDFEEFKNYNKGDLVQYKNAYWAAADRVQPKEDFDFDDWIKVDYDRISKGLLPNLNSKAELMTKYYNSTQINLEQDADLLGLGLTAFRSRDYMEALNIDDVSQFGVYLDLIQDKGTSRSTKLFRNVEIEGELSKYDIFENWAIKRATYGAKDNKRYIDLQLDNTKLTSNPNTIEIGYPDQYTDADQYINLDDIYKQSIKHSTEDIFPVLTDALTDTRLPTAGYASLDDVDVAVFNINDLSELNDELDNLRNGSIVWIAKINRFDWGIYTVRRQEPKLEQAIDNLDGTISLVFDKHIAVNPGEIVVIKQFDNQINGAYRIINIADSYTLVIEGSLDSKTSTIESSGILFKLINARFKEPSAVVNSSYAKGLIPGAKIWSDESYDGKWRVYEKQEAFELEESKASTAVSDENYGASLAQGIDYSGMIIGAPEYLSGQGTIYPYVYDNEINSYVRDFNPINRVSNISGYGTSVDMAKHWAVVGAPTTANKGVAVIIRRDLESETTPFAEFQVLALPIPGVTDAKFGTSVTISEDEQWIYVSSPGTNQVHAYQYRNYESNIYEIVADGTTSSYFIGDDIKVAFDYELSVKIDGFEVPFTYLALTREVIFATPPASGKVLTVERKSVINETSVVNQPTSNISSLYTAKSIDAFQVWVDYDGAGTSDPYILLKPDYDYTYNAATKTITYTVPVTGHIRIIARDYFEYVNTITNTNEITGFGIVHGEQYEIVNVGTSDFTQFGATSNTIGERFVADLEEDILGTGTVVRINNGAEVGSPIPVQQMGEGLEYKIVSTGTTDFTQYGSTSNANGTVFTAEFDNEFLGTGSVRLVGSFGTHIETSANGQQVIVTDPRAGNLSIGVNPVWARESGRVYVYERSVERIVPEVPGATAFLINDSWGYNSSNPLPDNIRVHVNGDHLSNKNDNANYNYEVANNSTSAGVIITNLNVNAGDKIDIDINEFNLIQILTMPTDKLSSATITGADLVNSAYVLPYRYQDLEQVIVTVNSIPYTNFTLSALGSNRTQVTFNTAINASDFIVLTPYKKIGTHAIFQGARFGDSLSFCRTDCSVYVGAPFDGNVLPESGAVARFQNISRVSGRLYSGNLNPTVTPGHSIRIDNVLVEFTGPSLADIVNDINTKNIPNVQAREETSRLVIEIINQNEAPIRSKMTVMPGVGTAYEDLGFKPFENVQILESPKPETFAHFGSDVHVDYSSINLVVGAETASAYIRTTFDKITKQTTFDSASGEFFEPINKSGVVYTYNLLPSSDFSKPGQFIFGQQLYDVAAIDNIPTMKTGDKFGHRVSYTDNLLVVTSPGYDNDIENEGRFVVFKNVAGLSSWRITGEQPLNVDARLFNSVYLYDSDSKNVNTYLDYLDPINNRLLGVVQENLDYVMATNPAVYNHTQGITWAENHVGKIWWDTTNTRYLEYNQIDLNYSAKQWGQLFPGSSIDVYEWIESDVPPEEYPGEVYSTDYSMLSTINSERTIVDKYYFWAKNTTSFNTEIGKTLSVNTIAQYLEDPQSSGIPFASFIDKNIVALYNVNDYLTKGNEVLHIEFNRTVSDNNVFVEYDLIRENHENDFLPTSLYKKVQDSFCGVDSLGNAVPANNLSNEERYGIEYRPRQTLFVDRIKALEYYINTTNNIIVNYPLVESRSFNLLNTEEKEPSAGSNEFDNDVLNVQELNYQDLSLVPVGYRYLVHSDETQKGFWTIYEVTNDKTFELVRVQSYDTSRYWQYRDWYAEGYDSFDKPEKIVETYSELIPIVAEPGTIYRIANNSNNKWELYEYDGTTWNRIALQDGTLEILTLIYDLEEQEKQLITEEPVIELRQIIRAINEEIFVNNLAIHRNQLLIGLFEYILAEQGSVEWLYKTSLIDVSHKVRNLTQYTTYKKDNQDYVSSYIKESKPYHVKVREFLLRYEGLDLWQGNVTDFDIPSYYSSDFEQFISPVLDDGIALLDTDVSNTPPESEIWTQEPWIQWYNNHKLTVDQVVITNRGTGYTLPPTIEVTGECDEPAELSAIISGDGSIRDIVIENAGAGYRTTPTVNFVGGNGTDAAAVLYTKHDTSRSISTTLRYDRMTYQSKVVLWEENNNTLTKNLFLRYEGTLEDDNNPQIYRVLEFNTDDAATFDPAKYIRVILQKVYYDVIDWSGALDELSEVIQERDVGQVYKYANTNYQVIVANNDATFDPAKYEEVIVEEELDPVEKIYLKEGLATWYQDDSGNWINENNNAESRNYVRYGRRVYRVTTLNNLAEFEPTYYTALQEFDDDIISGVDRTYGFYVSNVNKPGLDIALLVDGVDFPGIKLDGPGFGSTTGFGVEGFDILPWDNLEYDEVGALTYNDNILDTEIYTTFLGEYTGVDMSGVAVERAEGVPNYILGGGIDSVTITNPGIGYDENVPPVIEFSAPFPNENAIVSAVTNANEEVQDVVVNNEGFGYLFEPVVTIIPANPSIGEQAYGEASIDNNGYVIDATITVDGNGYEFIPQVTFSLPESILTARAELDSTLDHTTVPGGLGTVTVTWPGTNYLAVPDVTVTPPPVSVNAQADAIIGDHKVQSVTPSIFGNYYANEPTVTAGGPTETPVQATAVASVSNGFVSTITINQPGYLYETAPTVTIIPENPTPGVNATAVDAPLDPAVSGFDGPGFDSAPLGTEGALLLGDELVIINNGMGYSFPPTVNVVSNDTVAGVQAEGVVILTGMDSSNWDGQPFDSEESVDRIEMVIPGSGYTVTPFVVIGPPDQPGGVQATAEAVISGDPPPLTAGEGYILAVNITNPGSGYTVPPTVMFGVPDTEITQGIGAQVEATISGETVPLYSDQGQVVTLTVTATGTGYITPPSIIINGPDEVIYHGDGNATAEAVVDPSTGLASINIINPGLYYDLEPAVEISSPTPTRSATITSVLTNGQVTGYNIVDGGWGYNEVPGIVVGAPDTTPVIAQVGVTIGNVGGVDEVTGSTIITPGAGYLTEPTITVDVDPSISNLIAQGYAVVDNRRVVDIVVTHTGDGYQTVPSVTLDPPTGLSYHGQDATAEAVVVDNRVTDIVITNSGFGYDITPTTTIEQPTRYVARANGYAIITGDQVTGIDVYNPGSGYIAQPTILIGNPSNIDPDVPIVGAEFIDTYHSHAPEELIPGSMFDTLDFKVHTRAGYDYTNEGHGFEVNSIVYDYDGSSMSFADITKHVVGVGVSNATTGTTLYNGYEYTIDWSTLTVSVTGGVQIDDWIKISVYSVGGGNQLFRANWNGVEIVDGEIEIPVKLTDIQDELMIINGDTTTAFTIEQLSPTTSKLIFDTEPAAGDFISLTIFGVNPSGEDYSWSKPIPELFVADGVNTTFTLTEAVDVKESENLVVELNGRRLRPPSGRRYYVNEDLVEVGSLVPGQLYEIEVPGTTDWTLLGSPDNSAGTTFEANDAGPTTDLVPGTAKPYNVIFDVASFDESGIIQSDVDGADVSVYINNYKAVYNIDWYIQTDPTQTRVIFYDPVPADSILDIYVNNVDGYADYRVVGDTVEIIEGFGINLSAGDKILVISWGDPREQDMLTKVFQGPITITEPLEIKWDNEPGGTGYDSQPFSASTGLDVSVNQFALDREVEDLTRLWVTLNGSRLSPGEHYTLSADGRVLNIVGGAINDTDEVVITSFTDNIVPNELSFRIFKDMRDNTAVYRITDKTTTFLTEDLLPSDDVIHVDDANKLPEPKLYKALFGIVEINGERITYRERDIVNNELRGLRRGTAGTGMRQLHRHGDIVTNLGKGNLLTTEYNLSFYNQGDGTASDGIALQEQTTASAEFLKGE